MEYLQTAPVASFIFAFTILTSVWAFYSDNIYAQLILHPFSIYRGQRVYTVVSSGFIHADIMHLLFNMLSFSFFAFGLEPVLGHWQFGVLYFVSLILSDLPTVYKHKNDEWYHSLGASGAVSAVIFSYILYSPVSPLGLMLIPGFQMPAVVFGVLYLIYCNYAAKRAADNINHDAHMFGALSGLLITIALHPHVVNGFINQITEKVQSWMH
ncbi:rhomboid family intramembrane serine protease [Mucilaginibacter flavidus]|uniref:rhomboid family intramembrane serine protease n=1 Tax=Mucilaginibacter flavidus TaxID=2949309 RepID=UPI002093AF4B|nr:rhomboid family intramembrane serine protease [Mucilaginibacter flavidus]MCO5950653.1 rhomboid family intramembrane serine protease [Mucilaginibacter flavidus]